MRTTFLIITLFAGVIVFGQDNPAIDSTNYYNHFSNGKNLSGTHLTTDWLRINEALPIIIEELETAGYKSNSQYALYELPTKQKLILSAYCSKSDFGFLYMEGHNAFPEKKQREIRSKWQEYRGVDYVETYYRKGGDLEVELIKHLPDNIFILQEDCYWFQYTDSNEDNKLLVTKESAIRILRSDIKSYLKKGSKSN